MAEKKTKPVNVRLDKKGQVVPKSSPKQIAPVKAKPKPKPLVSVQPTEVSLGSLNMRDEFLLKGERYRVAEKVEDFVVTNKLAIRYVDDTAMWLVVGTFTFGTGTLVKRI